MTSLKNDKQTRVVILAGAGKGFCAGHDLKEIQALKEQPKIEALFGQCSRMMQTIPQLAAAGDRQGAGRGRRRRLPARRPVRPRHRRRTRAKFVTSGVTWGFFCSTPGVAIGRNLQRKHAMEMLLTGEPIGAAAGAGMGPGQPGRPCRRSWMPTS